MKKLLVPLAALLALSASGVGHAGPAAPTAQAGCWATVGLSSLPKPGLQAGQPWIVTIRVLQHGRTPLAGAKPEVRIRRNGGKLIVFRARATARVGSYRARVVFPAAGRYSLRVYDGFVPHCAQVHTFKSVLIVPV
jgi:hypothetical protein